MKKLNLILLFLLLLLLTGCSVRNNIKYYHQYYEPVKSVNSYDLMQEAFNEAIKKYGKPKYPVQQIYLYSSDKRDSIAEYAMGDISNWNGLINKIVKNDTVFLDFQNPQKLSIKTKLEIVCYLNKTISNSNLTNQFFFFSSSKKQSNRKVLDKIFSDAVLHIPFKTKVRTGFSLTEIVDKEKGIYAIYIDAEENSNLFKLLLFHEVVHLLNPEIFDWYLEGFNNCFSEYMAKKLNISWDIWNDRFLNNYSTKKGPYAIAYKMMNEIKKTVPLKYNKIIQFVKYKTMIDIEKWITTLSKKNAIKVKAIIYKYSRDLRKVKGRLNSFEIP